MAKEDYIMRYIQKLGQAVAIMIGLRKKNKPDECLKVAEETAGELLKQDWQSLLFMNREEFNAFIEKENYLVSYLELLAKLFHEAGKAYELKNEESLKLSALEKSLLLYRLLNEKDKTFSFEREEIINTLKSTIEKDGQAP